MLRHYPETPAIDPYAVRRKLKLAARKRTFASGVGDPDLLAQVDGEVAQVSADGAYDSESCHCSIAERGAQGHSVVLPNFAKRTGQPGYR